METIALKIIRGNDVESYVAGYGEKALETHYPSFLTHKAKKLNPHKVESISIDKYKKISIQMATPLVDSEGGHREYKDSGEQVFMKGEITMSGVVFESIALPYRELTNLNKINKRIELIKSAKEDLEESNNK